MQKLATHLMLVSCCWLCLPETADGGRFRSRGSVVGGGAVPSVESPASASQEVAGARKALDEVNRQRTTRGLRAYLLDLHLQAAAEACATYRARWRIRGHCSNDFQFLPTGGQATATGCAAWPNDGSFGACAILDGYTYAGAATVVGADGLAYHQLFVR